MKLHQKNAQTAIEYLILLSLVAVIVMFSFSHLLPRAGQSVSSLFSRAGSSIMGETVQPIDGDWCDWSPCLDCTNASIAACLNKVAQNITVQYRLCDCPAPLGSGAVCSGPSQQDCNIE
ncbi:MAG TPA: hypothetical protein VJA17_05300 [Candidatus Omnitrophota bacterium]|nr:hypothetical protein [Candidatus Omnitrophota bacterium]